MTREPDARVLLVGDGVGVPQALRLLPTELVVGIIAASNRRQDHPALAAVASELNVPLLVQPGWSSPGYRDFVRRAADLRPSLILCNGYSMLLRPDLLATAPVRVNVHGGKVPEYRGPNPIQWSIINDERDAGITIHHMNDRFDAGDVIARETVPIHFDDRWSAVAARVATATERLLAETLPAILAGRTRGQSQDESAARTWPRRTPDDGRIDWDRTVLEIHNLVRALGDGLPPAFFEDGSGRVELDGYLSPADVTALKYAPGPAGRKLTAGNVILAPEDGSFVRFAAVHEGTKVGSCGLEHFDPERRTARIWARPEDARLKRAVAAFAHEQLGVSIVDAG